MPKTKLGASPYQPMDIPPPKHKHDFVIALEYVEFWPEPGLKGYKLRKAACLCGAEMLC